MEALLFTPEGDKLKKKGGTNNIFRKETNSEREGESREKQGVRLSRWGGREGG